MRASVPPAGTVSVLPHRYVPPRHPGWKVQTHASPPPPAPPRPETSPSEVDAPRGCATAAAGSGKSANRLRLSFVWSGADNVSHTINKTAKLIPPSPARSTTPARLLRLVTINQPTPPNTHTHTRAVTKRIGEVLLLLLFLCVCATKAARSKQDESTVKPPCPRIPSPSWPAECVLHLFVLRGSLFLPAENLLPVASWWSVLLFVLLLATLGRFDSSLCWW